MVRNLALILAMAGLLSLSATARAASLPERAFPGEIVDLVATPGTTGGSVVLTWTVPIDAAIYRVYRAPNAMVNDSGDMGSVEVVTGVPVPGQADHLQSMTVGGLTPGAHFWFLIVAFDLDLASTWSNIADCVAALPESVPPAAIADLKVTMIDAWNNVYLKWKAPGDDGNVGTATTYDVRFSPSPILTLKEFEDATHVQYMAYPSPATQPVPALAGTEQTMMVAGQYNHLVAGTTYWFAIRTADEVPNWSAPSNPAATPDVTAPATVDDLTADGATSTSITLHWTAPGDDDRNGIATLYYVRYSTQHAILTEADFLDATPVVGVRPPQSGPEVLVVTDLLPSTMYWFALKTADEASNWSGLSTGASLETQTPDTSAPSSVTDLTVPFSTNGRTGLTWTAPGDDGADGRAATYDLRYSDSGPILTDADFEAATPVAGLAAPALGIESVTIADPMPGRSCWFALKTSDEVPNWSALSNTAVTGGSGGNEFSCGGAAAARASLLLAGIAALLSILASGRRHNGYQAR